MTEEIDDLWRTQRRKVFELEQKRGLDPTLTFEDAIEMFPHPRGGWKAGESDARLDRTRQRAIHRSRNIPLVFVYIWGINLGVVLIGILLILTGTDPVFVLPSSQGASG